jgi:hypothetical protein
MQLIGSSLHTRRCTDFSILATRRERPRWVFNSHYSTFWRTAKLNTLAPVMQPGCGKIMVNDLQQAWLETN